jgi:hypothetical protein
MDYIHFFLIDMKVTAKIPWPQLYQFFLLSHSNGCFFFKFSVEVGVEESIVNVPSIRITGHASAV